MISNWNKLSDVQLWFLDGKVTLRNTWPNAYSISKAVANIKDTINSVEKRVDAVEADTAIKKSTDLGGSAEVTIKKSKWNGSFLGSVDEIFN
mgnify:CR=1 FL=1